ncbi:alpha-galactosidase [Levilactobacillus zymae]|uniref:Alpha-galactosidase n=1 Tax=Levilactobacillus zymae TaxID=267363 RepID=A0ABQ0WVT1_9LACO|nr:alpha-galactosidase [Levilactobacillus zymae]KRL15204.1 alpha-galactosidase [Levilactobacillus zymae DSM 19395]QFR61493.1 alpha-galactosidase [Levilactobacillus zymae]GEO71627.1 alpha-galactosidase [Levilactobacillus zymae]
MAIFTQQDQFHLQMDHSSYLFHVMANGELGQLYYGPLIHNQAQYPELTHREIHGAMPAWKLDTPDFQPEALKQEYASFGKGDFRGPAYQITAPDGSRISELQYQSYRIENGKQRLANLPSMFDDSQDDAQTLVVTLKDAVTQVTVELNYTIFPHQDVLVRSATFSNQGEQTVTLNRALSGQLDLPDADYDFLQFSGSWARERHAIRTPLRRGIQSIGSLRSASSHQENPGFILARPQTNDDQGSAYGFNLVYSGNFLDQIEVDQFDTTRVLLGINPTEFGWQLTAGAQFQTPEAILSYSDAGLNQLSQQMGACYQHHLVNPQYAQKPRPILINNWEGTYFDFNETKLIAMARQAKDLGIELFVLDDGWFGKRNDDTTSLGDWDVNPQKLPQGMAHLAQQIHDLGMQFGLWYEPEMISLASQLYRDHPDWVIKTPQRQMTPGRNQFVLDMTNPDVVDFLYAKMSAMIDDAHLDYIKWDMNRNITEAYSPTLSTDQQLEFSHRYILGVYQLYARLTHDFPQVLFESCASGGGRFDLGMMYYAPQAWTSDDTDAIERLRIQFGTSYAYPQAMMGAHVSAVPNDQTGRITPIETRAAVAYFGDLGYELDVTRCSAAEKAQIKRQVAFYKHHRELFQQGTFYRLDNPFTGDRNVGSWLVVSADKRHAIAARYQILNQPNPRYSQLKLRGLLPSQRYVVSGRQQPLYGDELMHAGVFIPSLLQTTMGVEESADFSAQVLVLDAVDD